MNTAPATAAPASDPADEELLDQLVDWGLAAATARRLTKPGPDLPSDEVAQVVAAGSAVSAETGEAAVIAKMIRVMLLAPFLLLLAQYLGRREAHDEAGAAHRHYRTVHPAGGADQRPAAGRPVRLLAVHGGASAVGHPGCATRDRAQDRPGPPAAPSRLTLTSVGGT